MINDLSKLIRKHNVANVIAAKNLNNSIMNHYTLVEKGIEYPELYYIAKNGGFQCNIIKEAYSVYMNILVLPDEHVYYKRELSNGTKRVYPTSFGWTLFMDYLAGGQNQKHIDTLAKLIQKKSKDMFNSIHSPVYTKSLWGIANTIYENEQDGYYNVYIPEVAMRRTELEENELVLVCRQPVHTGNNIQIMRVKSHNELVSIKLDPRVMKTMDGDFDGDRLNVSKLPSNICENMKHDVYSNPNIENVSKYDLIEDVFGFESTILPNNEASSIINKYYMKVMIGIAGSIGRVNRWTSYKSEQMKEANETYWRIANAVVNCKNNLITEEMIDYLKDTLADVNANSEINSIISGQISILENTNDVYNYIRNNTSGIYTKIISNFIEDMNLSMEELVLEIVKNDK
jgi:hypothetical protein